MIREVYSENAPEPVGPYSQAIRYNDLVFVSGQIPIDASTGEISSGPIEDQVKLIFNNISEILLKTGLSISNILKVDIFLADLNDFTSVNAQYERIFSGPIKPARCVVEVKRLPKDVSIEISCIAGAESDST